MWLPNNSMPGEALAERYPDLRVARAARNRSCAQTLPLSICDTSRAINAPADALPPEAIFIVYSSPQGVYKPFQPNTWSRITPPYLRVASAFKHDTADMTSTTSAATIAVYIKRQELGMAEQYFEMATTALLLWHYFLTVEKEFRFFWRRRFSGVCALFLANRYVILVTIVYQSPWWGLHYTERWQCQTVMYTQYFFEYLQYLVWAVFSCLRVYALQMRWCWAVIVLILSLSQVAYGVVVMITTDTSVAAGDCDLENTKPPELYERLAIAARVALIVAEIIVMAVTWAKMSDRRRSRDVIRVPRRRLTLSSVFYENGRVYFVLILVLHSIYLVYWTAPLTITTTPVLLYFTQLGPLLIEPTIGILVNHFLIELQEAATRRVHALGGAHSSLGPTACQWQDSTSASDASTQISLVDYARADVDEWLQSAPSPAADAHDSAADCRRG